jgi:FkbM family methyltransferase
MADDRLGRLAHRAVRIAQTPRVFRNWPTVLRELAGGPRRAGTLTFETRTGLRISCPNVPGARVPVYEVFAENCYRLDTFLGPLLREPLRVVDIGAHVGTFACHLAAAAPEARIACFEPSPVSAAHLRGNVLANGFADRVLVREVAVTARAGQSVLADNGGGSALNTLLAEGEADGAGLTVDTTTFDALVAGWDGPADVVKIDCEGGEYDLVLGSSPQSWAAVRRVVLEYHPHARHTWPQLRRWFADRGLLVTAERPQGPRQGTAWLARR